MFDGFRALKALKPGETPLGMYQDLERFGRFEGIGSIEGEFELPVGEMRISVERYRTVEDLDVELAGPDGAVHLARFDNDTANSPSRNTLYPIADAKIDVAGPHRLRVASPDQTDQLIVMAGTKMTAGAVLKGMLGR